MSGSGYDKSIAFAIDLRAGASMPRSSRLFFNSLLAGC